MPLRKSPVRTPALVGANRANSLKSTGPRTPRGKARASLNALKHGRHARRLPEKLVRAGYLRELAVYSRVHSIIVRAFLAHGPFEEGVAAALAAKVWCLPRLVRKTKPESSLDSTNKARCTLRTRIVVKDYRRRIGLVFWVQRRPSPAGSLRRNRCGWTSAEPEGGIGNGSGAGNRSGIGGVAGLPRRLPDQVLHRLEDSVRCWVHRLARPRLEERIRYSLDRDGVHRPELEAEHWRDWPELCRLWGTPNVPASGRRKW
jgi:hypothetical protein